MVLFAGAAITAVVTRPVGFAGPRLIVLTPRRVALRIVTAPIGAARTRFVGALLGCRAATLRRALRGVACRAGSVSSCASGADRAALTSRSPLVALRPL